MSAEPHGPVEPSAWVVRHAPLVPPGGTVLDLAAGRGRHTRLFCDLSHNVVAVDHDVGFLTPRPGLEIVRADLETAAGWPLGGRRFAGIVVTNYLWRPLFPAIRAALAPGGALIYETFAAGNQRFGKPDNPDFLLRPNELLELARGLTVVAYEHGEVALPRPAMVQRLAARA